MLPLSLPPSILFVPLLVFLLLVVCVLLARVQQVTVDDYPWRSTDNTARRTLRINQLPSLLVCIAVAVNSAITGALGLASVHDPDRRSLTKAEIISQSLLRLQLAASAVYLLRSTNGRGNLSGRAQLTMALLALVFFSSSMLSIVQPFSALPPILPPVLDLLATLLTLAFIFLKPHSTILPFDLPPAYSPNFLEDLPTSALHTHSYPLPHPESPTNRTPSRTVHATESLLSFAEDGIYTSSPPCATPALSPDISANSPTVLPLGYQRKMRRVIVSAQIFGALASTFSAAAESGSGISDGLGARKDGAQIGLLVLRSFQALATVLWTGAVMSAWWFYSSCHNFDYVTFNTPLTRRAQLDDLTTPYSPSPIPAPIYAPPRSYTPKRTASCPSPQRPPPTAHIYYLPQPTLARSTTTVTHPQALHLRSICPSPLEDFQSLRDPFAPPSPGVRCSAASSSAASHDDHWLPPSPTRRRPRRKRTATQVISGVPEVPPLPSRCDSDSGREELVMALELLRKLDERSNSEQIAGASTLDVEAAAVFGGSSPRHNRRTIDKDSFGHRL